MPNEVIREACQLAFDEMFRYPQPEGSVAIDEFFPEKFANELSRWEAFNKHLFRPNTYLHKWWARRCSSTFRLILKQFVPSIERRDYYAPGGLEGKVLLDPMMGGGTTLHEAIRLGANVIGGDIDPIPIVQARATLTQVTLSDLRAAFDLFFADLYAEIGQYFQTECPHCHKKLHAQYLLYGLRKCCDCGEVVQIDQYQLRYETDRTLRIWPENWAITEDQTSLPDSSGKTRLITKAETVCPVCGEKYQERLDLPYYARYVPFVVVGTCPKDGLFFRSPSEADLRRIRQADMLRDSLDFGNAFEKWWPRWWLIWKPMVSPSLIR